MDASHLLFSRLSEHTVDAKHLVWNNNYEFMWLSKRIVLTPLPSYSKAFDSNTTTTTFGNILLSTHRRSLE